MLVNRQSAIGLLAVNMLFVLHRGLSHEHGKPRRGQSLDWVQALRRNAPAENHRARVHPGVELAPGFLPARTVLHSLVHVAGKALDEALATTIAREGETAAEVFARLSSIAGQEPQPVRCMSELLDGCIEQVVAVRAVEDGEVEVVFSEHWLGTSTPTLMRLLQALNGRAAQDRSRTGWHYRYCNQLGQHSDALLGLDPRSAQPAHVYWERSPSAWTCFNAHVPSWRSRKRRNVIAVCLSDAKQRELQTFRQPGAGARQLEL
ncbi:hypothetical protein JMJ56_27105 [Belnapia sp. T18]|uniref:Uncharacterized protein n=1 Tax=Belnapia arida TaxID=2804533 RepID=A0ABS1UAE5_9PROT|nr:hypothetical protein [Belnapia arida]MBL6081662.1 hypothetical protein [Belnapia arida]